MYITHNKITIWLQLFIYIYIYILLHNYFCIRRRCIMDEEYIPVWLHIVVHMLYSIKWCNFSKDLVSFFHFIRFNKKKDLIGYLFIIYLLFFFIQVRKAGHNLYFISMLHSFKENIYSVFYCVHVFPFKSFFYSVSRF